MNSQLRKLSDHKENLEENIENGSGDSVPDDELETALLKRLAELGCIYYSSVGSKNDV